VLTLVLTRHGLTTRSYPEQHLGQTIDVPLSADGREQALALAERLGPIAFERIVSSPMLRSRQTAETIADVPCITPRPAIETDARLLEMDYGTWEGLTYEQIDAHDADERRAWEADPATIACPSGESGNDVADRARRFLDDLLAADQRQHVPDEPRERPVLVVAHSSLNRVLLCVALGIPIAEYRNRVVQSQVNLTAVMWKQGAVAREGRLLLLNDVSHVRRPPQVPWE
jgi:broad specificity phosphatase PhoE